MPILIEATRRIKEVIPSGERTANFSSDKIIAPHHKGGLIIVDVTAESGGQINGIIIEVETDSGWVTAQALAFTGGARNTTAICSWYPLWFTPPVQGAAISSLPAEFRITVNHANASGITYSVKVHWLT